MGGDLEELGRILPTPVEEAQRRVHRLEGAAHFRELGGFENAALLGPPERVAHVGAAPEGRWLVVVEECTRLAGLRQARADALLGRFEETGRGRFSEDQSPDRRAAGDAQRVCDPRPLEALERRFRDFEGHVVESTVPRTSSPGSGCSVGVQKARGVGFPSTDDCEGAFS